jgi:hypothetical protein
MQTHASGKFNPVLCCAHGPIAIVSNLPTRGPNNTFKTKVRILVCDSAHHTALVRLWGGIVQTAARWHQAATRHGRGPVLAGYQLMVQVAQLDVLGDIKQLWAD